MKQQVSGKTIKKQYCKISVAMAVYQGEAYLESQVDSILAQLGNDDELIISYDPSTDCSEDLILAYQRRDPRVKVVYDEGRGIVDNFNTALKHCAGNLIFISDQDDLWLPDKVTKVQRAFNKTGCDLVIHNGVHIDEAGEVVSVDFFSLHHIGPSKIVSLLKPRYSGCCMAFSKTAADFLLPLPTEVTAYDHWLGFYSQCFGRVTFLPEVLIHHRLHGGNVTPPKRRRLGLIVKSRWLLLKAVCRRKRQMKA